MGTEFDVQLGIAEVGVGIVPSRMAEALMGSLWDESWCKFGDTHSDTHSRSLGDWGVCRSQTCVEAGARAGPPALVLLHEVAEFAASTRAVSKKIFMENAMRDLSTALCVASHGKSSPRRRYERA